MSHLDRSSRLWRGRGGARRSGGVVEKAAEDHRKREPADEKRGGTGRMLSWVDAIVIDCCRISSPSTLETYFVGGPTVVGCSLLTGISGRA